MNDLAIRPNRLPDSAAGFELCLVTDDPDRVYMVAVEAGAVGIKPAEGKPWSQRVAYVRDLNGCLVEPGSPVAPPG